MQFGGQYEGEQNMTDIFLFIFSFTMTTAMTIQRVNFDLKLRTGCNLQSNQCLRKPILKASTTSHCGKDVSFQICFVPFHFNASN